MNLDYTPFQNELLSLLKEIKGLLIQRPVEVKTTNNQVSSNTINTSGVLSTGNSVKFSSKFIDKGITGLVEYIIKHCGIDVNLFSSEKLIFEFRPKGTGKFIQDPNGTGMLYKFRDSIKANVNEVIENVKKNPSNNPTMNALNEHKIKLCESILNILDKPDPQVLGKEFLVQVRK